MTILLIVLLAGCLVMHLFMMRKGGHAEGHGDIESKDKNENSNKANKNHSGHGCCH